MASGNISYHPLHQSCFYKLPSKKKLAKILFTSTRNLENLSKNRSLYHCWDEPKKCGGFRTIEAPHKNLKVIQKRIAELLHRIKPPDFLMAPVKRRSYVHNAAVHVGARAFSLLDIENFFPSCTDKKVYWFFHKKMHCAPDVAAILTKLATFRGHLPQGSPCSPILAYYAYIDMWEAVSDIIAPSNCRLSIYADDITISGSTVYERDVWAVKQALYRHGHRYNCRKERRLVNKAADITGVIVSGDDLLLPNRQHKQLRSIIKQRQTVGPGKLRETIDRQLRGRVAQANQILGHP